jgi:aminoglycoside 6'-N-acetyltransferase
VTGFVPLRTARLTLRPFTEADAGAFAAYRSDPGVARYQSWDAPYPLASAVAFIRELAAAEPDRPGEWFQIALDLDGELVGDCAFAPWAHEPRTAEIGFTLAPGHQRRGYAREAVTALLGYLLDTLGKHRVTATCDARNLASARVLEAVGMRREGHLVEASWAKGEWTDDFVYALLAREWPAGR